MSVNWDTELFAAVHGGFGEPVNYLPATGSPFTISDAIFEQAYRSVTVIDGDVGVTSETPAMTVRLSSFPAGTEPTQDDKVSVASMGTTYIVREARIDRHGRFAILLLNFVSKP